MYYLTTTAKRKNAKRHIAAKWNSVEHLKQLAKGIDKKRYIVEIYNGKWELIERVEGGLKNES